MRELLLVGAGGFLGSAGRYLVSGLVHRVFPFALVPYGTLAVNIAGCLAIGLLGGLAESRNAVTPDMRLFVFIGVLGGFTTFSSFALETLEIARDADLPRALANIAAQVVGCLAAAWAGHALGRSL